MDECLDEYIEIVEDSIELLRQLVNDINAHHKRYNLVKTAGTAASIAGSVLTAGCILAASFTGGASIVALTGTGLITGMAGTVTNLGTDVVDMIWTNKYQNELCDIDRRMESVAERFAFYLDEIEADAAEIYKKNRDEAGAIKEAVQNLIMSGGGIGWNGYQVSNIAKNLGRSSNSTLLRNGGQAWKTMRLSSNFVMSTFKKIGVDVSKRAAFNVVKGGTIACNVFYVLWDVKSLAKSLNNNHPAIEVVQTKITEITQLLNNLEDIRSSLIG